MKAKISDVDKRIFIFARLWIKEYLSLQDYEISELRFLQETKKYHYLIN